MGSTKQVGGGSGEGPRSLRYSRPQGRAVPREIRQQTRMAPPPMTHPSPQASCEVDTVDSSGWTALHHAGGYSLASPWPPWPPEAELGIVLPGVLVTCLGHIPPPSSRSSLLCIVISFFLFLAVLCLHCIILRCAQASLVVAHRLTNCSTQTSLLRSR